VAYCTTTDLAQYLPQSVLGLATLAQQQQACDDASQEADSYLRGRYQLPLLAWGKDVTRYTAWIACYLLAQLIGFAPQAGADRLIVERYYQAVGWPDRAGTGWFPGIQRQAIHPDVTPSLASPGNATYDLPQVRSAPMRGWSQTRNGKPVAG
jgi:phage gp36-like protein